MTTLLVAVFLLVVMPALLFWMGRLAASATDGRKRTAAQRGGAADAGQDVSSQEPWYRRPMQPAFSKSEDGS